MKLTSTFDNSEHRFNYKRWHKCVRCRVFTLFDDKPEKTRLKGIGQLCPACWEKWKELPQYRLPKKKTVMKSKVKEIKEEDWGTIGVLLYILVCSICLGVVAYYLWWK